MMFWSAGHAADRWRIAHDRWCEPMKAERILIVEDDEVIATLIAEVLEGMDHGVCAVESTEAGAVAAAIRCVPDLMIVDARLTQGSGVAAMATILRSGFVPHVFISGDALGVPALPPGAVVIRKPFRVPDLARAIQRALGAGAIP